MIERLFLHRIEAYAHHAVTHQGQKPAVLVHPDGTEALFSKPDAAVPETEITAHCPVWQFFPQFSLHFHDHALPWKENTPPGNAEYSLTKISLFPAIAKKQKNITAAAPMRIGL